MSNGIFVFILLLVCALSFISGAGIAMCHHPSEEEEKVQVESEMHRQWSDFLSYDGNGRE